MTAAPDSRIGTETSPAKDDALIRRGSRRQLKPPPPVAFTGMDCPATETTESLGGVGGSEYIRVPG